MMKISILNDRLIVDTGGDPAEVLAVKKLPGRFYDPEAQTWTVPIRPGLSAKIHETLDPQICAALEGLIEAAEAAFLEALAPPVVTPDLLWSLPARYVVDLAVTHHFYTTHRGDMNDFARVHHPFVIGE